jgi:hypothetical protein
MVFMSTEVVMTWFAPALLGAVLGLLVYLGINPPGGTPVLAIVFTVAGLIMASLVAYGFRRFVLPEELDDEEESVT